MKHFLRCRPLGLTGLGCLLLGAMAAAFPPAPDHTFHGLVRNEWGDPINVNGAVVYIETTNGAGANGFITTSTTPGINYRLTVPMDSGRSLKVEAPSADSLRQNQPFRLKVLIGTTIYLPIEMALGPGSLGQPGGVTRLDLTLGVDSDGDGLPDAWEEAIIGALGGTLAGITPDGDADGDGLNNRAEYLAGTFAFDPTDGFSLSLAGLDDGRALLEFVAIRGRTYSIRTSTDLQQWTPASFRVVTGGVAGPLQDSYASIDVRQLQIEVPVQAGPQTNRYFKAFVQ